MKLSILICSLFKRADKLSTLLRLLSDQIQNRNVEVLIEIDNKQLTTGKKRDRLLRQATGDYVVFIDDDDRILEGYIEEIMKAMESNPDCIGYEGIYTINGRNKVNWKLSKEFQDHDANGILYRRTNHISPVKREIALLAGFPDKSNAEDKAYSERIIKHLHTEVFIPKELYHYDYSSINKEYA